MGMGVICRNVGRGGRPPCASGAAGALIARYWAEEPSERPTMEEVVHELANGDIFWEG